MTTRKKDKRKNIIENVCQAVSDIYWGHKENYLKLFLGV
jgi:hypothetical protein